MQPSRKRFGVEDQQRFAALSGDTNPIHMDPLAARRTQVGVPIVHGMHGLLWALDAAARALPDPPFRLKASFDRPMFLDEPLEVSWTSNEGSLRGRVEARGIPVFIFAVSTVPNGHPGVGADRAAGAAIPEAPVALDLEQMADQGGLLRFATPPAVAGCQFAELTSRVGPAMVAALACLSSLVGMVCPGLTSILSGLDVDCLGREAGAGSEALAYRTEHVDERFRSVRMAVEGGGLRGVVDAFARPPPTVQPTVAEAAGRVLPDSYRGATALVVGGSRGMGEVVAKLVAAGGGRTIISYATGEQDARRVGAEIDASGGDCLLCALDVRRPIADQLRDVRPTHVYYFATCPIFIKRSPTYDQAIFETFIRYYVTGFNELCSALLASQTELTAFYPSSVAVEERPANMTEYAMAKAAGEILCADLTRFTPRLRIVVSRLPRVLTDQTASIRATAAAPVLDVLAPLVAEVQGRL